MPTIQELRNFYSTHDPLSEAERATLNEDERNLLDMTGSSEVRKSIPIIQAVLREVARRRAAD